MDDVPMATLPSLGLFKNCAHFPAATFPSPSSLCPSFSWLSVHTASSSPDWESRRVSDDWCVLGCSTPYCSTQLWQSGGLPEHPHPFSLLFIPHTLAELSFLGLESYFKPPTSGLALIRVGCSMGRSLEWHACRELGGCYLGRAFQPLGSVSAQLLNIWHGLSDRARYMGWMTVVNHDPELTVCICVHANVYGDIQSRNGIKTFKNSLRQ